MSSFKQKLSDRCFNCNQLFNSSYCIPDKYSQRKILSLVVKCKHCDWSGTYGNFIKHCSEHKNLC